MEVVEKLNCVYFNKQICTSCKLIEINYLKQLEKKEALLLDSLVLRRELLLPTIRSELSGFRNKAKFSVTGTPSAPIIGLIGGNDLDEGREILACPIHHPEINRVMSKMPEFLTLMKLVPYQIKEKRGELKGIICFYSETSGEMYLRFVLRSTESVERIKKQVPFIQELFPFIKSISANLQPVPHAILEGSEEIFLTERRYIMNQLADFQFQISPKAFIQTNQKVALKLYQTAAQWVSELKINRFCELYCGQGAFSFFASSSTQASLGIEINEDAVKCANEMTIALDFKHLKFVKADVQGVSSILVSFSPDVVLVNPPRKGLGKSVSFFTQNNYPYLIYSSCSHESLSADLSLLGRHYEIKKAQIFDMFPHTNHFETLVLLKKRFDVK